MVDLDVLDLDRFLVLGHHSGSTVQMKTDKWMFWMRHGLFLDLEASLDKRLMKIHINFFKVINNNLME